LNKVTLLDTAYKIWSGIFALQTSKTVYKWDEGHYKGAGAEVIGTEVAEMTGKYNGINNLASSLPYFSLQGQK